MGILVAGVLLWAVVHLMPAMAQSVRASCVNKLGENGYKGVFSLLIALSLVLIVVGWRGATPDYVYHLPPMVKHISMTLMLLSFILLGASMYPTRIKKAFRHPQLMAVVVWSIAHLLVNGDSRSIVLFGGMGVWALLEIIFINRRDGAWIKAEVPGWGREIRGLVISLVIFVAVMWLHPYITGVQIIGL